jgi:hypothetical protein
MGCETLMYLQGRILKCSMCKWRHAFETDRINSDSWNSQDRMQKRDTRNFIRDLAIDSIGQIQYALFK